MKLARNRARARWLPTRFQFSLFRLWALVRFRTARDEGSQNMFLAIESGQSAIESYSVAVFALAATACYLAAALSGILPPVLAAGISLALAGWVLQVPLFVVGPLLPRNRNNQGIVSAATLGCLLAASAFAAGSPSWIRFVGWTVIAAAGLEVLAFLVLLPLRGTITRMEAECAG